MEPNPLHMGAMEDMVVTAGQTQLMAAVMVATVPQALLQLLDMALLHTASQQSSISLNACTNQNLIVFILY